MENMRQFFIQENKNAEKISIYKTKAQTAKIDIPYIKKTEMDKLYPAGGFSVLGQIGKGKTKLGTVNVRENEVTVYATAKLPHTKILGYVCVGENEYLSVVKDVLLLWILWALLAIVLCVALVFGIRGAMTKSTAGDNTSTTAPGMVDPNAQPGLGELDLPDKVEDMPSKSIAITGIVEMKMKAGQKEQNVILTNAEANKGVCFMTFAIYIDKNNNHAVDESDELLYQSDLVQPGYSISKITLNRPLAAGEYNIVVMEQPYSFDKQRTPLNRSVVVTKAIVENAE